MSQNPDVRGQFSARIRILRKKLVRKRLSGAQQQTKPHYLQICEIKDYTVKHTVDAFSTMTAH